MRECWVNVYPSLSDLSVGRRHYMGLPCGSVDGANVSALGLRTAIDAKSEGLTFEMLRAAGVGYRLHVRLKPEAGKLVIEPSAKLSEQGGRWHADRLAASMRREREEADRDLDEDLMPGGFD